MREQNGLAPFAEPMPRLLFLALNRGCESLRCSWWSPGFNMAGIKGVSGKAGSANILETGERRYFGKSSSIGLMTGLAPHSGPRGFLCATKAEVSNRLLLFQDCSPEANPEPLSGQLTCIDKDSTAAIS